MECTDNNNIIEGDGAAPYISARSGLPPIWGFQGEKILRKSMISLQNEAKMEVESKKCKKIACGALMVLKLEF